MKRVIQSLIVAAVNGFLLLLSAYLIWGWITLSDIRSKCEKKGYDFDAVMASLISSPSDLMTFVNFYSGTNAYPAGPNSMINTQFAEFGRYGVRFLMFGGEETITRSAKTGTNEIVSREHARGPDFIGGLIEPFAFMSENFVNFIFCLGIGYLMSSTLLLLKVLKRNTLALRYVLLRPIAGALVSACLFLLVISGGALFWGQTSHMSGLSIGVLAAFGAVWCERFERLLKRAALVETEEKIEKR